MKLQIVQATQSHFEQIEELYKNVLEYLGTNVNYPGWKKDIYPTVVDIEEGIKNGTMYVATLDDRLAGSMILNHESDAAYQEVAWGVEANASEYLVVHTLLVDPVFYMSEFKVATRLMEFADDFGRNHEMKAIRLDVYENNVPAIKLYEKLGYNYISSVDLGYRGFGLENFRLYEKLL